MIFHELYPGLCRFLECMVGRRGVAQEIVQESFLRLYRTGLDRINRGEVRFWLFRVARNLALNELEKEKTRKRLFVKVFEAFGQKEAGPGEKMEQQERLKIIREALQLLPEHQRAALLLREQEEMSYSEIADVLGVSESKVKVDIFRGRNALRAILRQAQPCL